MRIQELEAFIENWFELWATQSYNDGFFLGGGVVDVCVFVLALVCVCLREDVLHNFSQVSRLSLYGHTGVLGSGHSPFGEAHGAGQGCVPVLPLDQCDMHFRPDLGSLPRDHPGSGVLAPWLPPGQLHSGSSTSPSLPCCPTCCVCIWAVSVKTPHQCGARSKQIAAPCVHHNFRVCWACLYQYPPTRGQTLMCGTDSMGGLFHSVRTAWTGHYVRIWGNPPDGTPSETAHHLFTAQ